MNSIDLAFVNREAERRFANMVIGTTEEIGGILFYNWGQLNGLHWAKQNRLFGMKSIGLISDWIVCPNVSNLRDRKYQVSDLEQLIGIAEATERSRGCFSLHFHTHPRPNANTRPSKADLDFWWRNFNFYGSASGVIASESQFRPSGIAVVCHSQIGPNRDQSVGRFLSWQYINYVIRRDAKRKGARGRNHAS